MKTLTLILSILLISSAAIAASMSYKTYYCQDAEEAKALLSASLQRDVAIIPFKATRKIFVLATVEEHQMIAPFMKQLSAPRANIKVEVEFIGSNSASAVRGSVYAKTPVTYSNGKLDSDFDVRLNAGSLNGAQKTRQTLTVRDGGEARLFVGESVPQYDWLISYGKRWGYAHANVEWKNVGAYLIVKPKMITDEYIKVSIIPELSGTVNGKSERIRYQRMETEVTVENGQTIRLGGLRKDNDFYARFLKGRASLDGSSTLDIKLTPTLLQP